MKHITQRMLSFLLVLVMLASMLVVPADAANRFEDVPSSSWFAGAVNYVQERGWMNGVGNDNFAPYGEVTRSMFVTVLARYAGAQTDSSTSAFSDVPTDTWYTGAVSWAAGKEIVNGVGSGAFAPYASISRQDLCTILARFLRTEGIALPEGSGRSFTDAERISGYAAEAVALCAKAGLVAGFEDGSFRPQATSSRAQVATILMRLDLLLAGTPAPAEPMPAQSFEGRADDGMTVKVEAPEGALPAGTEMIVSRVTDESKLDFISGKVSGELLAAVDISFHKDGEIEPQKEVQVQIAMAGLENALSPSVVHVSDGGEVEAVPNAKLISDSGLEQQAMEFQAKNFSIYAVVDGGEQNERSRLLVEFYHSREAGAQPVYSVYVTPKDVKNTNGENGESVNLLPSIIADPPAPELDNGMVFCGWNVGSDYTEENVLDGHNVIEDIREAVKARLEDETNPVAEGETFKVYAMVMYQFNAIFKDENGEAVLDVKTHYSFDNSLPFTLNVEYAPYELGYRFFGWMLDGDSSDLPHQNGSSLNLTPGDSVFRANVQKGYWLSFEENPGNRSKGAKYVPPVFCVNGEIPVEAQSMLSELAGHHFEGWYDSFNAAPDGPQYDRWGNLFNFMQTLDQDTTVYARFSLLSTVPYKVIVWKQNVTDSKNAADGAKTYDYAGSSTLSAAPGTNISALALDSYINQTSSVTMDTGTVDLGGFVYNSTRGISSTDTQVQPSGNTVINIYYNRKLISLAFNVPSGNSYSLRTTFTGLYGQTLTQNGYAWPTDYMWLTSPDGDGYISFLAVFTTNWDFYGYATDYDSYVYHIEQNLDGSWPSTAPSNRTVPTNVGNRMIFQSFPGFKQDSFRVKLPQAYLAYREILAVNSDGSYVYGDTHYADSRGWTDWIPAGINYSYTYNGTTYALDQGRMYQHYVPTSDGIYFRYARQKYDINYMVGEYVNGNDEQLSGPVSGNLKTVADIYYQTPLGDYAKDHSKWYDPTASGEPLNGTDFYFAGWYLDPDCTKAYDFIGKTMPEDGLTLYARFIQKQYRVFLKPMLDPSNPDSADDTGIVWNSGDQEMNFRRDYLDYVSGGSAIEGTRDDYVLVGWYLDSDYSQPYNFEARLTDAVAKPYDKTVDMTDNVGTPSAYNADVDRPWITQKVTLYAKWRRVLDGANGVKVVYSATAADGRTGSFPAGDNTSEDGKRWTDPLIYADGSAVKAETPPTPADTGYQFDHWEILNKEGEPSGKTVEPGMNFVLDVADAVVAPAGSGASGQSAPQAGSAQAAAQGLSRSALPTPAYLQGHADSNPRGATTVNMTAYVLASSFTSGKEYLIVNSNQVGSAYALRYNSSNSGNVGNVAVTIKAGQYYTDNKPFITLSDGYASFKATASGSKFALATADGDYHARVARTDSYKLVIENGWGFYGDSRYWDQYISGSSRLYNNYNNCGRYLYWTGSAFATTTTANSVYIFEKKDISYTLYTLNEALNVSGGNLNFTSTGTYPWTTVKDGSRIYAQSGNAGVHSSNSTLTTTVTANEGATISFEWQSWGEGTNYDISTFQIDGAAPAEGTFQYGDYSASNPGWKTATFTLSAGTHTLTWNFKKDGSTHKPGDHFMVDNVRYTAFPEYTVRFVDGHTGQVLKTQTVLKGRAATAPEAPDHSGEFYYFTGWNPADFSNIQSDLTVTAEYEYDSVPRYTVIFKDWNGNILSIQRSIHAGEDAVAPADPSRNGYTFLGWDKEFKNVQRNLVVTARYTRNITKSYTVTLRAVYVTKVTQPSTHIDWYGNGGTIAEDAYTPPADSDIEAVYEDDLSKLAVTGITSNEAIAIPDGEKLSREGYEFLGWARLASNDQTDPATLTEANLFLRWDALEKAYYAKIPETASGTWQTVSYVAADELQPYDNLYAVWGPQHYFVFHSSDGSLEARPISYSLVEGQLVAGAADLSGAARDDMLYGGLYQSYGQVDIAKVEATAASYRSAFRTGWADAAEADVDKTYDLTSVTGIGFTAYEGVNSANFWTRANAVKADSSSFTPERNKVYYLKEVPNSYLSVRPVFTGPKSSNKVTDMYLLSAIDDSLYKARTIDGTRANLAATVTIVIKDSDEAPIVVTPADLGVSGGYVMVTHPGVSGLSAGEFSAVAAWTTLDSVDVSKTTRGLHIPADKVLALPGSAAMQSAAPAAEINVIEGEDLDGDGVMDELILELPNAYIGETR